jgi:hypothetical protein
MNNHPRRSNDWDRAGEIEDFQSLLMGLENLRGQIEHKALFEQGYDEIFDLAIKMIPELRQLKLKVKRLRDIAVEIARERN